MILPFAFDSSIPAFESRMPSLSVIHAYGLRVMTSLSFRMSFFFSSSVPRGAVRLSDSATILDVMTRTEPSFIFGTCSKINRARFSLSLKIRVLIGLTIMDGESEARAYHCGSIFARIEVENASSLFRLKTSVGLFRTRGVLSLRKARQDGSVRAYDDKHRLLRE